MKQIKIYSLAAALLLLLACSSSANDSSLLWKVSGNGLDKPSYIFGTHHLVPISFLDSVNGVIDAFESTEQTVGEIDMGNMMEMQMKIMSEATMPAGVTYNTLLDPDDVEIVDSTLISLLGAGLKQFGTLKPAMLSNIITITLYQQFYPRLSTDTSLDQYFQDEAHKRNKSVMGLETAESQIEVLLNSQDLERQAELLVCIIRNPELLKQQMDDLHAAYHSQDINSLLAMAENETENDPCPSTEEERDAVNKNRNLEWLEKLPSIMSEKSSFIAVGSLHLPGEHGLIEGLKAQGYSVEPIN